MRVLPMYRLLAADLRNAGRDPMLLMSLLGSLLLGIVFRYVPPALEHWIPEAASLKLPDYYGLMLMFILQLVPLLIGMAAGFMMLDERDEKLIGLFAVTPLQNSGYLLVRLGLPALLTVPLCLFLIGFTGLAGSGWQAAAAWLPALPLLALLTPAITLFLAAFAANKVEGLALAKGAGLLVMATPAVWFLPWPAQAVALPLPTFWAAKLQLAGGGAEAALYFSLGIIVQSVLLWGLYWRMKRRVD